MNPTDKNSQRLTDLETSLMHAQNDFDAINEVVLELARRMDGLANVVVRLTERLDAASQNESDRTPEDDKPPHY